MPTISRSRYGSSRSRVSTSVTSRPSAAKIDTYSIPITPAPITIIDRGMRGSARMVSESNTVSELNGTSAGWCGRDPVAITTTPAESTSRTAPAWPSTSISWGARNRACPSTTSTRYRPSD